MAASAASRPLLVAEPEERICQRAVGGGRRGVAGEQAVQQRQGVGDLHPGAEVEDAGVHAAGAAEQLRHEVLRLLDFAVTTGEVDAERDCLTPIRIRLERCVGEPAGLRGVLPLQGETGSLHEHVRLGLADRGHEVVMRAEASS